MNTSLDMYRWYLKKMLIKHPTWKVVSDQLLKKKGIMNLMTPDGGVYMTYTWFRAILEKNNTLASQAVIDGERYDLGHNLGFLLARRIERNFSTQLVNFPATKQARRETGNNNIVVYWTEEDYCVIGWHKDALIKNKTFYEYKAAKDFKLNFNRAIKGIAGLKFKFLFFPLNK